MGNFWRSKAELISDVLQWTPSHRYASVGRTTRTSLHQVCTDSGCSVEDQSEAMYEWVSSALVRQLVLEKEYSEFKPVKLCLKIDLVSYPAQAEGLVNMTGKHDSDKWWEKVGEICASSATWWFSVKVENILTVNIGLW